ncbi:MAG: hypothetical protein E7247_05895 [Paenibacillaceae bacterium]|nr:hypothetical protein [Paenibacillaceae bacterium]
MVDIEKAEEHLKLIFRGCLGYINNDLKIEKKLDIKFQTDIEEKKIFAKAEKKENGEYKVTVSLAAYNIIHDYYKQMLVIEGFYNIITLRDKFEEKIASQYLYILIEMTLRTIIFHELGHIFNGHIDYIKFKIDEYYKVHTVENNVKYVAEFLENSKISRSYLEPIDWQALEWNADDFAITRLIGQYTYIDNIDGIIIKSIEHAFYLITAVVVSMYCLMEMNIVKNNKAMDEYKLEEHLPKRFRLQNYIKVAELATKHFNRISLFRDFNERQQFEQVIIRFEEWYVLYTKIKSGELKEGGGLDETDTTVENNREQLDGVHISYYSMVNQYYLQKLPQELKNFTYFKIYYNT